MKVKDLLKETIRDVVIYKDGDLKRCKITPYGDILTVYGIDNCNYLKEKEVKKFETAFFNSEDGQYYPCLIIEIK